MKKRDFLISFSITFLLLIALQTKATIYTIGNDTIHFFNGNYHFIDANDTVLADTSVITIAFVEDTPLDSISAFESNYNLARGEDGCTGNYQYTIPVGRNFISISDSITNEEIVENLISHFYMRLYEFEPDDDDISDQWYLKNIGVYDETTLSGVWEITKGSSGVIVAVLDTGLDWDSEEFGPVDNTIDAVYNNSPEDDWTSWNHPNSGNDTDDDNNDYIDDFKGWDFMHIDQSPGGQNTFSTDNDVRMNHPEYWHGNAVAGIIAAKTNNSEGVAGIAGGDTYNEKQGVKILPVKVADLYNYSWGLDEWMSTADVEKAICYATNMGAKVINMSFGCSYTPKENLEEEVDYAHDNGVTLIAAAGNEGIDIISYPAKMEKIIAVGATDQADEHLDFSNTGDEMEISAPGVDIIVIEEGGEYTTDSWGTSFSAPMVSATVGLMLSVNPDLTNGDLDEEGSIRYILKSTADETDIYHPYVDGWNKYLGYGRLNTYDAVCMAIDYKTEITVENNDTWDERVISKEDIVIKEGVNLTITGEVMMGEDAKIIVEQGAVLTVDGGIITNMPFCHKEDERWAGIEVWGVANDNQYGYTGHPVVQGKLILESATIENAIVAVSLFDSENTSTTTGGIVTAKNSVFKNNITSALFNPYQNILFSNEHDYVSHFKNCTFTVDEDFIGYSSFNNMEHIMMFGVKGVKLYGCAFENELDDHPDGRAIHTNNAGFNIKGACESLQVPCPEEYYNRTTFDGFYRAIECTNAANVLYSINITESDFTYNGYGIYFGGVNDATVVGNNIELGYHDDCEYGGSNGIYLDNCKRFAIEKNRFTLHNPAYAITNIGIHTVNTNNAYDEVYNNAFDDMIVANYAEGKNWEEYNWKGLAYYCNDNQDNNYDFYVDDDDGNGVDGIQKYQGSRYFVTGNKFSSELSATGHFHNFGSYEIDYYYDLNEELEVPDNDKIYRVIKYERDLANTCPTHYSGGDIKLNLTDYEEREDDYEANLSDYNYALFQYDSIGREGDSATLRLLEEQMSDYNMLLSRAAYDIIRSNLTDTVTQPALFETWQEDMGTYSAVESIVDLNMQQGNYTTALNYVDSLQSNFVFSSFDSIEYIFYSQLKTTQAAWLDDGRDIFELTSTEEDKLEAIADSSRGIAGAQARGILSFALKSTYSYFNCARNPDSSQKSLPIGSIIPIDNNSLSITVKPNPARNEIIFSYSLPNAIEAGELILYNSSGILIDKLELTKDFNDVQYNCSHLKPGVYFYSISCSNSHNTGKFVIVR